MPNSLVVASIYERRALPVLVAGFALLCLLLLVCGVAAVGSMRFLESDAVRFAAEQQATARLIDEVQREEGNLSSVFYSLAAGNRNIESAAKSPRRSRLNSTSASTPSTLTAVES